MTTERCVLGRSHRLTARRRPEPDRPDPPATSATPAPVAAALDVMNPWPGPDVHRRNGTHLRKLRVSSSSTAVG